MYIEQIDKDKIKAVVDEQDQREFGVCYETMNYSDDATRRLCEKIISIAKQKNGFRTDNSKLLVEAKPNINGSVTLYISRIPIFADNDDEYLCQTVRFGDPDAFMKGCEVFAAHPDDIITDALYEYEGCLYLYFELYTSYDTARRLLRNLLEYSERTALSFAWLDEHTKKISEGSVPKMLGALKKASND